MQTATFAMIASQARSFCRCREMIASRALVGLDCALRALATARRNATTNRAVLAAHRLRGTGVAMQRDSKLVRVCICLRLGLVVAAACGVHDRAGVWLYPTRF